MHEYGKSKKCDRLRLMCRIGWHLRDFQKLISIERWSYNIRHRLVERPNFLDPALVKRVWIQTVFVFVFLWKKNYTCTLAAYHVLYFMSVKQQQQQRKIWRSRFTSPWYLHVPLVISYYQVSNIYTLLL